MTVRKEDIHNKRFTQKRAIHIHRPTFISRQILPMSPAQYRRYHFGSQKETK